MIKKKELQNVNPTVIIENKIFIIRGQKVMLDSNLAEIYQIPTKALIQAIKRNLDRFPSDFMFQLTKEESGNLRSQSATSNKEDMESNRSQIVTGSQKHRDPRYLPYAFTEHGVAMLSSVLNSSRAVQMNIFIIRAFIKLREISLQNKDFDIRILDLEFIQTLQGKDIKELLEHLRYLTRHSLKPLGPIGFQP